MKRLLYVLVLVGAGAVALGFYLGWFHVGSDTADGKSNVTLSVDTDKFQKDRKTAVADVQDAGRQVKDKVAGPSEKNKDGTVVDKDAALASNRHDGKAVSITGAKLVMTNTEGPEEHTYTLTADIKVTCDGKVCKAADLKPGMRVRVTTENTEPNAATGIEALDTNRTFEKGA
jgi:hypothetical protein